MFKTIKNIILKKINSLKRKFILFKINKYKEIDGWLTPVEAIGLYTYSNKCPEGSLIIEIGSWKGKSTYCLAKGAKSRVKVIAIDPFDCSGEPGSKEEYKKRNNGMEPIIEFTENMNRFNVIRKIETKKGYSKDYINQINQIDLLFIDGDHSIEGCRYDFENYSQKIRPGGFLLFHDYDPSRKDFGPTWVIENLVIPSNKFEKTDMYGSLCVFKKKESKKGVIPKEYIKKFLPKNPVILEAGAHIGTDTCEMADVFIGSVIYAFEPVSKIFKQLKKNTTNITNIKCFELALGSETKKIEMYVSSGTSDGSSSLLEPKEHLIDHPQVIFNKKIKVNSITLADWASKNNVKKIDFFWLDLQGLELNVLKTSPELVRNAKAIYTEVSTKESYKNQTIYSELRKWLESFDFKVNREEMPWGDSGNVFFIKNDR